MESKNTNEQLSIGWMLGAERRLTVLEVSTARTREHITAMKKRLSLLEKGLLLVVFALQAVAHEKLPEWARYLAEAIKMMLG